MMQQELFKRPAVPTRPPADPKAPAGSDAWSSWCYERALAGMAAGVAVEWNRGVAERLSAKWRDP